jgi:RIO-like serine/threonine protein kinase
MREGRWANARVSRVQIGGDDWVVKDFASRGFWARNTIGRFLLGRELRALCRLQGIDGVPADAFRVDGHAIAARFIPGARMDRAQEERLTGSYFRALEDLLRQVHARGIVHLDTRGAGNVLITPEAGPALIDFQSSLDTGWMPAGLRRLLEDLDLSGAYKRWLKHDPASLDDERRALYERITERRRRLWPLRGYFGEMKRDHNDVR